MTLAIFLVVAAVLSLVVIFYFARSRSLQISEGTSLAGQIQPIDIEAFRNLIDPAEDEYLRRRLSGAEFRTVQRKRLRAMAAYIWTAAQNAGCARSHCTTRSGGERPANRGSRPAVNGQCTLTAAQRYLRAGENLYCPGVAEFRIGCRTGSQRLRAREWFGDVAGAAAESRCPGSHCDLVNKVRYPDFVILITDIFVMFCHSSPQISQRNIRGY